MMFIVFYGIENGGACTVRKKEESDEKGWHRYIMLDAANCDTKDRVDWSPFKRCAAYFLTTWPTWGRSKCAVYI